MNTFAEWIVAPEQGILVATEKDKTDPKLIFIANFVISKALTPYSIAVIADKSIADTVESIEAKFVFKNRNKVMATEKRSLRRGRDLNQDGIADFFLPFDDQENNYKALIAGMIDYGSLSLELGKQKMALPLDGFTKNFNQFFLVSSNVAAVKTSKDLSPVERLSSYCAQLSAQKTSIWMAAAEGKKLKDFEREINDSLLEKSQTLPMEQLKQLKQMAKKDLEFIASVLAEATTAKPESNMINEYVDCMENTGR